MQNPFARIARLRPNRRAQSKAHCAKSAACQKLSGIAEVNILDRPHLVLSHIRGKDASRRGHRVNYFHDLSRRQRSVVGNLLRRGQQGEDMRFPKIVPLLIQTGIQNGQRLFRVGDHIEVRQDVLVHFGAVNIDLYDLRL